MQPRVPLMGSPNKLHHVEVRLPWKSCEMTAWESCSPRCAAACAFPAAPPNLHVATRRLLDGTKVNSDSSAFVPSCIASRISYTTTARTTKSNCRYHGRRWIRRDRPGAPPLPQEHAPRRPPSARRVLRLAACVQARQLWRVHEACGLQHVSVERTGCVRSRAPSKCADATCRCGSPRITRAQASGPIAGIN